ncbi:putative endonuclease/exonuclease/phosphatase family protein [Psychromonas sp. CNPT3]|uniref:endonuclease/exonuclease/phosphatase family protein n=1 Tax=Psychromonas sp. CNPT3 TaxID=314282 RepID=UPI00006E4287|nr:endonuclease/exonuclease/phosphatase family protein [Psychromonas sp. CNPT3]AGH80887.1 putative endonuclease/exonuclease/phosphatase family protein [Psychromonas sp. CNPT3]
MKKTLLATIIISLLTTGCDSSNDTEPMPTPTIKTTELTVLTANVWNELSHDYNDAIENPEGKIAYLLAVDEMKNAKADIILLQESGGTSARLAEDLNMYLWQGSDVIADTAILSKYPIMEVFDNTSSLNSKDESDTARRANVGVKLDVNGRDVVVWSNHLDYTHYINYDARGGDGVTWSARFGCVQVTDTDELYRKNMASKRPAQIQYVIDNVKPLIHSDTLIIVGGDFNEPSGLDWTDATESMFDHKGVSFNYESNKRLLNAGLTDTYREIYPDPVTHPGITWPYNNEDSWMDTKSYLRQCGRYLDDRDRIDFIYYNAQATGVKLSASTVVGPYSKEFFKPVDDNDYSQLQDIHEGLNIDEDGKSHYSKRQWPSDHLWYKSVFSLQTQAISTTKIQYFTPQFEHVTYEKQDHDIKISFNLTHLDLWNNEMNYIFELTPRYQHATFDNNLQTQPLREKPLAEDVVNIMLNEDSLNRLIKDKADLQIRYTVSENVDGYHKIYAVKTIPLSTLIAL